MVPESPGGPNWRPGVGASRGRGGGGEVEWGGSRVGGGIELDAGGERLAARGRVRRRGDRDAERGQSNARRGKVGVNRDGDEAEVERGSDDLLINGIDAELSDQRARRFQWIEIEGERTRGRERL